MANEEKKPTKKEVLKEIVRPLKEVAKETGKQLETALENNLDFYILPTAIRKDSKAFNFPGYAGVVSQIGIYATLIEKGIPAYLIPITSNVLSGIYELGRYVYKKAEQKVIDNKTSKLEGKLKK